MQVNKKQINETIIVFFILFLSLIILTPGNFGEIFGGETWKSWTASKILLEEGKFIDHTFGPLYYTFLTLLTPLDYKFSIIIEYFITHLFCLFAIYKLLSSKNFKLISILVPIAWIPFLVFIQSPKYILAIGFLCLHLSKINNKRIFDSWFPPLLLAAVACNWGYILFYIAHLIGKFLSDYKEKKLSIKLYKNYYSFFGLALIIFFMFSFINQSAKPYNNHLVTIYNHSPVELKSPFEVGFFQFANHRYVQKTYKEKDQLIKSDWYLTHKEIFGDCKKFLCVLKEKPKTIFLNIEPNIGWLSRSLTGLFFGYEISNLKFNYFIIFFILALSISTLGLIGLIYNKTQRIILISYILIGSGGYILALLLTGGGFRYTVSLMPAAILLINFSNLGISKINYAKKFKINKPNYILVLIFITILISDLIHYKKNNFSLQFIGSSVSNKLNDNYFHSYKEVFEKLNKNQKILSSEDTWINGFANVDINKVKGIFILPPFKASDDSIEKLLDSFDIITVSNDLKKEAVNISTKIYLRYKLHLKKYLEKNLDIWDEVKIQNYGSIYKNKSSY